MGKDDIKEEIRHEEELLRLAWVTAAAVGGGSISLVIGDMTGLRAVLAGLGFLSTLFLVAMTLRQERQIRTLLRRLKEEL